MHASGGCLSSRRSSRRTSDTSITPPGWRRRNRVGCRISAPAAQSGRPAADWPRPPSDCSGCGRAFERCRGPGRRAGRRRLAWSENTTDARGRSLTSASSYRLSRYGWQGPAVAGRAVRPRAGMGVASPRRRAVASGGQLLARHLGGCKACRAYEEDVRWATDVIRLTPQERPSRRITLPVAGRRRASGPRLAAAVAATAALAAGLSWEQSWSASLRRDLQMIPPRSPC